MDDEYSLKCPITLSTFRDPVLANDGHVYEREPITHWILEHGTSPLTRAPLSIDELVAADNLRELASQRRHSTVSYNVRTETVVVPPITITNHNQIQIFECENPASIRNQARTRQYKILKSKKRISGVVFCILGIAAILIVGLVPLAMPKPNPRFLSSTSSNLPWNTTTSPQSNEI